VECIVCGVGRGPCAAPVVGDNEVQVAVLVYIPVAYHLNRAVAGDAYAGCIKGDRVLAVHEVGLRRLPPFGGGH